VLVCDEPAGDPAIPPATNSEPPAPSPSLSRSLREILVILSVLLVFQTGIVQAFNVPTGSMEDTVLPGDFVVADKITLGARTPHWFGIPGTHLGTHLPAFKLPGLREVERGDIVVVEVPVDRQTPYLKRVVALGGDRVEVRNKRLLINGEAVEEPSTLQHEDRRVFPARLVQRETYEGLGNRDNFGPFVVPTGFVFLMGDNRDYSFDSRFFGPVPEDNIIGRARVVSMSVDLQDHGIPLWRRIRWDRIGKILH
jgi:signal peptidase I